MSEPIKIERKFLIQSPPVLEGIPCTRLRQGYIATGAVEVTEDKHYKNKHLAIEGTPHG